MIIKRKLESKQDLTIILMDARAPFAYEIIMNMILQSRKKKLF